MHSDRLTPSKLTRIANTITEALLSLDENKRQDKLRILKQKNMLLYSLVSTNLNNIKTTSTTTSNNLSAQSMQQLDVDSILFATNINNKRKIYTLKATGIRYFQHLAFGILVIEGINTTPLSTISLFLNNFKREAETHKTTDLYVKLKATDPTSKIISIVFQAPIWLCDKITFDKNKPHTHANIDTIRLEFIREVVSIDGE
jgi:hypothetical protein